MRRSHQAIKNSEGVPLYGFLVDCIIHKIIVAACYKFWKNVVHAFWRVFVKVVVENVVTAPQTNCELSHRVANLFSFLNFLDRWY